MFTVWGLGFRVWGLGFRAWGLGVCGFGVWGFGFWVWGLGFRAWGLGLDQHYEALIKKVKKEEDYKSQRPSQTFTIRSSFRSFHSHPIYSIIYY